MTNEPTPTSTVTSVCTGSATPGKRAGLTKVNGDPVSTSRRPPEYPSSVESAKSRFAPTDAADGTPATPVVLRLDSPLPHPSDRTATTAIVQHLGTPIHRSGR